MKILSIGNFGHGWDGSICDEEHIAKALEDLGHEVFRGQRESWTGLINEFNKDNSVAQDVDNLSKQDLRQLDFILISQWHGYPIDLFDYLHSRTAAPIIYWAFDYQADGQEWHEQLIKGADLYLSKRIADSKYPNWQWLSQDFAPEFLDEISYSAPDIHMDLSKQDIDVLFTGSYLPWATERNEILKVVDEKFNLVIHSVTKDQWEEQGFKDVRGPIMDDGLPGLYARAKINLSIDHTIEAGYWSDRVAQILCCGGFVLHRYQPLCEVAFKDAVQYFYNTEDCLSAIEYYLPRFIDRNNFVKRSYSYAQANLKVKNRVKDLLTIVGGIL